MKKQTIYIDVFAPYDFDFMYWYISTDGVHYIMQELNVGPNQCNDFYSIFSINRSKMVASHDEKLGSIWLYEEKFPNERMVDTIYKIRQYECSYNDFMNVMSIYNEGRIFRAL